jgi:PleD family two-component response regulator
VGTDSPSRGRALALDDELRSCLATIVGNAVLLESEDPDVRRDAPGRIVASVQQLSDTLERRAREANGTGETQSQRVATRRALLIDDDPDSRRLLQRMFPPDFELLDARDPDEALSLADDPDVTIVMMAWRASTFSPPEILAELKIHYPRLPVLVIADQSDDVYAGVAEVLGADVFLTRPVNSLQLLTAVDDLLRTSDAGLAVGQTNADY